MRIGALLLVVTELFGQRVNDPHQWLENASSPKTQTWIAQQNARAESVVDGYPGNQRIAARVAALSLTGEQRYDPQLRGDTLFYMRETPPQPQAMLVAAPWPSGAAQIVVDPATYGKDVSIDFYWPSPSGRLVALATSAGGSEAATIRVAALKGNETYSEALGPAGGGTTPPAVVWDADERGFTYGRLPADGSQFGIQLYHHVLGTPQSDDTLALDAVSHIAEFELIVSQDGNDAAALVHFGDGSPDRVYLRRASRWFPDVGPEQGITGGAYVGDRLLVVATQGSPHGVIAAVRDSGALRTVVPEASDWAYHDVAPIRGGFLVTKSWGTAWRVDQYTDAGRFVRTVALPHDIGIDGIASNSTAKQALIAYSGWTTPPRWVTYDSASGHVSTSYAMRSPSDEYRNVVVRSIVARSADGTSVPVTVLALKGTKFDGDRPTILTGYGGFGLSTTPRFLGSTLAWLELGGSYAVANIRGGAEFGEQWHQEGMLSNKQHGFDDFYASALALFDQGVTNPSKLGIEGGSNGGLLVGAALVQHPESYRAVVGAAGLYDMVRYTLFPNGVYNVPEYGSPNDPAQFRTLYAYSPYHHVRKGVAYPAVLLITSENDPRVASWHSWKFAEALQAATSSSKPIVVLTRRSGGHGHGASFAQRLGNAAVTYSFLAQQLGIR